MRRRPSGPGEDEDAPRSAPAHSSPSDDDDDPDPAAFVAGPSPKVTMAREASARSSRPASSKSTTPERKAVAAAARRSPSVPPPPRPSATGRWSSATPPAVSPSPSPLDKGALDGTGKAASADTNTRPQRLHAAVSRRNPWRCSLLTLATCLVSVVLLAAVVHSFLTRQLDPRGCAMSYMRPHFTHFSDFDTEHTRFASKYSLYLYREGGVDEDTRVKGVPVLFIPGNAGSYKQMRPIAAEAANYFQEELRENTAAIAHGKRSLDFFTVDFNEELSAFHGQTLLDQAEYLNEAVAYILALYHNPSRSMRDLDLPDPKSVIILGHSMGGVVARTMLHMPNYQEHSINTIITLSAPHARAPISFDADLVAAYDDVNSFWRKSYLTVPPGKNPLADVTLVSVAGGGLDTTIASEYTSLTSLVPDTHGFTVFTSSIPNVWTGMDHLAIMWCDQFRKALVRAIFDVIDVRRSSQTRAQPERVAALRRKLLTGMESVVQKVAPHLEPTVFLNVDHASTAILSHGDRLALSQFGASVRKAHVLPIPAETSEGTKFTLLTDQSLSADDEDGTVAVFLCTVSPQLPSASVLSFAMRLDVTGGAHQLPKLSCRNVVADVSLLPASTHESRDAFDGGRPFSYLQYDVSEIAENQFMAIVDIAAEITPGWLFAEFTTASESSILVSKGHHQLLLDGMHVTLPKTRPMMTEVKIPEVHSTMFAYNLEIHRAGCGAAKEKFAPLLRQYIQEPYESKYFVNARGGNINVHGISPYMPPPLRGGGASEGLSLQLWTDPTCNSTLEVSLRVDVLGSAGKLVMRYRSVFAAFPLLVVAIVLRKQFKVYDTTGVFISFSQSMDQCLRTSLPTIFTALTFLAIALSKASTTPWTSIWAGPPQRSAGHAVDFSVNDLMLGTSDPFFWFLVPVFGLTSVGICVVFNYASLILTHAFALVYALTRRATPATFVTTQPYHRLLTIAVLLILIGTIIPYQFAYIVLTLVHLVTCVRALRVARDNRGSAGGPSANFANYTHSMFLLLLFILPINIPTLVVWIHNLAVHWLTPFSTHHNLFSVLPFIFLVETLSTGHMLPRVTSRLRYFTNTFIFGLALYAAVFGVSYAYRLHHLANALCAWLFLLHLCNGQLSPAKLSVPPGGRHVEK